MPYALLVIIQPGHATREFEVGDEVVAVGRALDNTICLDGDTNVSRYHAEIEKRGDIFWLLDLGSSNGTTVNDVPVEFERQLQDGDLISVGGSTVIELHLSDTSWRQSNEVEISTANAAPVAAPREGVTSSTATVAPSGAAESDVVSVGHPIPATLPISSAPSPLLIIAGVAGGLVLTTLVAVLIFGIASRRCTASAHILSPQTGTTLRGRTAIRAEVEGTKCIERLVYKLDGVEVASVKTAPYDVILDPSQLPNVDAGNHTLAVSIEDKSGVLKVEDTILLAFDAGATKTVAPGQTLVNPTPLISQDASLDVRSMADRLAGQISRKSGYVFDRDLVDLIRVRSSEYRLSGYTDRARRYRREINKAFRDQGLDPLLGYVLAMSRSKFSDNATSEGIGLWQIPVAQAQGYLTPRESQDALKDPKRSAEIAAAYTKALVSTFESTDDFMFAVACFGLPLSQAGQVRTQLATMAPDPVARRDFLKMVKLGVVKGNQVDQVVRFFAAGIVTENPQAFDLPSDEPLSSL